MPTLTYFFKLDLIDSYNIDCIKYYVNILNVNVNILTQLKTI
jgi:hypothetical protein